MERLEELFIDGELTLFESVQLPLQDSAPKISDPQTSDSQTSDSQMSPQQSVTQPPKKSRKKRNKGEYTQIMSCLNFIAKAH